MRSRSSQARLTAEKLAELKDVPGFAATFLPDGKPPEAGTTLQAERARRRRSIIWRTPGFDDFYRGDVGREIAADLEKIGSPVTRDDSRRYQRQRRRAAERRAQRRHALQHAAADARAGVAHHPRAVRAAARRARPRASSSPMAWSRRPSARSACATASSPIRRGCRSRRRGSSTPKFLDAEVLEDRPPQGGEMAGALRRRRHDLDGRGRRLRPRGVLHPVALLGVRLGLRAARRPAC